jgi:hypothetical protein
MDRDDWIVAMVIGDLDDHPGHVHAKDNRRLIAAAPDMLRLLERVRDVFSGDVRPNHRAIVDDIDEFITGMQQDSISNVTMFIADLGAAK